MGGVFFGIHFIRWFCHPPPPPCHPAQDMKRAGVQPTVVTYSALMNLLAARGYTDQVFALYREMQSAGVAPNQYTYNALMIACHRAGHCGGACRQTGGMGWAVTNAGPFSNPIFFEIFNFFNF